MRGVAIYFEGGGDTGRTRDPLRRGMSEFLSSIRDMVRERHLTWKLIACGGRAEAYQAFTDSLQNEPNLFNVLLVDSEEPIPITEDPWGHLESRPGDGWPRPSATAERCQMMVACMEAWFLADPEGLKARFGGNFNAAALPEPNLAESKTKDQILDALNNALRQTKAKKYRKIRDGARLLETIDSRTVRGHCRWCDRPLQTLENAIQEVG